MAEPPPHPVSPLTSPPFVAPDILQWNPEGGLLRAQVEKHGLLIKQADSGASPDRVSKTSWGRGLETYILQFLQVILMISQLTAFEQCLSHSRAWTFTSESSAGAC